MPKIELLELLQSGGWLMLPITLCSVAAVGICIERAWSLRAGRVAPAGLLALLETAVGNSDADLERLQERCGTSSLGRIFRAGLASAQRGRERMREAMEAAAAGVVHDLERYLTTLGAIASVSPLLGLLGTVVGMIRVFAVLVEAGAGDVSGLAGGISEALVTTAAGLGVAIPALIAHRGLLRKVDDLVVTMEGRAGKLLDLIHPDPRP